MRVRVIGFDSLVLARLDEITCLQVRNWRAQYTYHTAICTQFCF